MYKNCQKWMLLVCCLFLFACTADEEDKKSDSVAEGETSAAVAEGETDAGADSMAEGETDAGADSMAEGETDAGADSMAEGETDAGADSMAEGETDAMVDGRTVISTGLAVPESVLYDQNRDVYLVSNINGSPADADNNGYIVVIDPADGFKAERWISGGENGITLNAPKGMAISNGVLWVADIDTLRRFYSATGRPLDPVAIDGSTFLNDVCAAPDGSVVVSDSGFNPDLSPSESDAIYRVFPDGTIETLVASTDLKHPNGVFCERDGNVLVVNFDADAKIYRIARDGQKTLLARIPKENLDGIEKDSDGAMYVSSWGLGGVYKIEPGKEPVAVVKEISGTADFALDRNRNLMVVPSFDKNELHIVPFSVP